MAKLTKKQLADHETALGILAKPGHLTYDERWFVLVHWLPGSHTVTKGKAFFTPPYIAEAVAMEAPDEGHVVDLGAGIGMLSWFMRNRLSWLGARTPHITAVEINPDFIRVGKRILPDVNWVEGDIFDPLLWKKIGSVDSFVTNPPFGQSKSNDWPEFHGNMALRAIEVGLKVCNWKSGVAVLPQSLCPFEYSGKQNYKVRPSVEDGAKFTEKFPQIQWSASSTDTTIVPDDDEMRGFADTSIIVEVVSLELREEVYEGRQYELGWEALR